MGRKVRNRTDPAARPVLLRLRQLAELERQVCAEVDKVMLQAWDAGATAASIGSALEISNAAASQRLLRLRHHMEKNGGELPMPDRRRSFDYYERNHPSGQGTRVHGGNDNEVSL